MSDPEERHGEQRDEGRGPKDDEGRSGSPDNLTPVEEATRIFINHLRKQVEAGTKETQESLAALARRESTLFGCYVGIGVAGVVLIVTGFVLILFNLLAVGVLSNIIGLLAGAGTLGFRRAASDTRLRRSELNKREAEDTNTLRAVGVTLMISDEQQRNRAMVELAGRLTEAVGAKKGAITRRPPKRAPRS